jgi:SpoVK/Ycf46/Vps4 family AAA+-type ATPase
MSLAENPNIKHDLIIMPHNLVNAIDKPNFLPFAKAELADKILIIEDAEELLLSRDSVSNPFVSTILNMTSGIYAEILNLKVIVTVNTVKELDSALLRKGRLMFHYKFKKLDTDIANKLLKHLGNKQTVSEPTTLADIFNIAEVIEFNSDESEQTKSVGFKFNN